MTNPAPPKVVVVGVAVVFTGGCVYNLVTAGDYRVTIALALAVLLTIGVDVGSVLRAWSGSAPPEPPPVPPAKPDPGELR